jgi:probable F420-dependent oxidoreductase
MARRPLRVIAQLALEHDFPSLLAKVRACEAGGFDAVHVPDHFYVPGPRRQDGGLGESWTTLAALAASTERIRLGGAVTCNLFRHPCLTAQIAATVDQISGGRLELGMGAGWMQPEFDATGIPFPRPGERIAMLAEALEVVLPALSGEPVSFEGRFYRVRDFQVKPACVQQPRPPLHIGGSGDKLLALAGRHAEIVSLAPIARSGIDRAEVLAFTPERVRDRVDFLRRAAGRAGRDPEGIEVLNFVSVFQVAEDEAGTRRMLDGLAGFFQADADALRRHPLVLAGTPARIVEEFAARREQLGVDSLMLPARDPAQIEVVAKEILPRLAALC